MAGQRRRFIRFLTKCMMLGGALMLINGTAVASEYIVKFVSDKALFDNIVYLKSNADLIVTDEHPQGQLVAIRFNDHLKSNDHAAALAELYRNPDVEYVVENIKMHTFAEPNDPRFADQWALAKVRATEAWDITPGNRDIVVAVIDTGIDYNHSDLRANMWINSGETPANGIDDDSNGFVDDVYGWDFRDNDNSPMDDTGSRNPGHGTHCAGIIGAVGNNAEGISGMTQNVQMMAIRFLGADGSGNLLNGAKAIDYAVENGADIISASWGASAPASAVAPILEAIERAEKAGVIFVAAAANDGANNDSREVYPANAQFSNVISVAASQSDDTKPSWSNYGKKNVHLSSPGHQILSTLPGNKYGDLSGTSMAAPLVSGLVALMLSSQEFDDTKLTGLEARSILQATGAKVNIETACNCRVDAYDALTAVTEQKLTVVPAAISVGIGSTQQFSGFGGTAPYTFTVADQAVATITETGLLTGKQEGTTSVTITDAAGASQQSLNIHVGQSSSGGGEQCPLQDPMLCMLMCLFDPSLPWCSELPMP